MVFCHATMSVSEEWVVDPDKFCPERWTRNGREYEKIHPCASRPFGHGPRMCVGRSFAELELYVLLVKLVQRFRVTWPHKDMGAETWLITRPDCPLQFVMKEREDNLQR